MRLRPKRSLRAPIDLRERLGIPARERVLAWGSGPKTTREARGEPDYVAATDLALYVEGTGASYPWDSIGRASWSEPVLEIQLLDPSGGPGPTLRLRITESGDLPAAVHDRVTASVIVSERIEVADGVRARMVARRAQGRGGRECPARLCPRPAFAFSPASVRGRRAGSVRCGSTRIRRRRKVKHGAGALCANILYPVSLYSTHTAFYSPSFTSRM